MRKYTDEAPLLSTASKTPSREPNPKAAPTSWLAHFFTADAKALIDIFIPNTH